MEKSCVICNKIFTKTVKESKIEWAKRKFCGYKCYWKSKLGGSPWNKGKDAPQISKALKGRIFSREWKDKISLANTGKKQTPETIEKRVSKIRREKHYEWLGQDVGYSALHAWLKKEFGSPDKCEHCPKIGLSGRQIHWANKTGLYERNRDDWLRLCVSCHRKYDHKNNITMKKYDKN